MEHHEQLNLLFKKYLNNSCNVEETQRLMEYFMIHGDQKKLGQMITDVLESTDESYVANSIVADVLMRVDRDLFLQIHSAHEIQVEHNNQFKIWHKLALVAAAVSLLFIGVYFFRDHQETVALTNQFASNQDVAPGDFGGTLTLANGKKIRLAVASNGELAKEAGISISKTAGGRLVYKTDETVANPNAINTLSTSKGETYQVHLPDGSLVYLNAASSLTYKASLLENGKRVVQLIGEGYFEVSKDKEHPFIVKTGKAEVEVLGTHFNISSYADDEVEKTTLLEGSVKLTVSGVSRLLKPGQQAKLLNGRLSIVETDTDLAVAWKNNEFVVESERIETIMKMIERWYNVEVVYVGAQTNKRFSGSVSRFDKISKVLQIVESTGAANFEIKGRKIYVSK